MLHLHFGLPYILFTKRQDLGNPNFSSLTEVLQPNGMLRCALAFSILKFTVES